MKKKGIKKEIKQEPETNMPAEEKKRLLMYIGVAFFMIGISVAWLLNIKYTFKAVAPADNAKNEPSLEKITGDLSKTIIEVKKGINEIKEASLQNNIAGQKESTTPALGEINELKNKLENNLENNNVK